jgi:hypothetical protein
MGRALEHLLRMQDFDPPLGLAADGASQRKTVIVIA